MAKGDPSDPVKRGGPKRGLAEAPDRIKGGPIRYCETGAKKVRAEILGMYWVWPRRFVRSGETGPKGVWQKRETGPG